MNPDEIAVVVIVWLALFGGTMLLGGGVVWKAIRRRQQEHPHDRTPE